LGGALEAAENGLIAPALGPEARSREVAEENRLDLKAHEIVDVEA
jgi:hypothetical protein